MEKAITRKKMIELASEVYVAADSTKFGKDVMASIAPLERIDTIVTDANVDRSYQAKFKKTDTKLVIAEV